MVERFQLRDRIPGLRGKRRRGGRFVERSVFATLGGDCPRVKAMQSAECGRVDESLALEPRGLGGQRLGLWEMDLLHVRESESIGRACDQRGGAIGARRQLLVEDRHGRLHLRHPLREVGCLGHDLAPKQTPALPIERGGGGVRSTDRRSSSVAASCAARPRAASAARSSQSAAAAANACRSSAGSSESAGMLSTALA